MSKLTRTSRFTIPGFLIIFLSFVFLSYSTALSDNHNYQHIKQEKDSNKKQNNNKKVLKRSSHNELDEDEDKDEDVELFNELFYKQRAYPNETIPLGARQKALDSIKNRESKNSNLATGNNSLWHFLGPNSITNGELEYFAPPPNSPPIPPPTGHISGRVTSISACCGSADNNSRLYIGSAQGGVLVSDNNGLVWTPLTDNQVSLAIGAVLVHPNHENIIYAGTGEGNYANSYFGAGLIRSVDGGEHFNIVNTINITDNINDLFNDVSITDLAIAPNANNVEYIYASTSVGLAGSDFRLKNTLKEKRGLFRSNDMGATWITCKGFHSLPDEISISKVQIDPTNPRNVYAATWDAKYLGGGGNSRIYKSTDSGVTWDAVDPFPRPLNADLGRVSFSVAASPGNKNVIWASVEMTTGTGFNGMLLDKKLLKSIDDGKNWMPIETHIAGEDFSCGVQCGFDNIIAVNPNDPNIVLFGGLQLYGTFDGGQTWNIESKRGSMHVDFHAILFDPNNSNRVIIGNDGGVWIGTIISNAGAKEFVWENANYSLPLTQIYSLETDPMDKFIVAGTQDNGFIKTQINNLTWTQLKRGDAPVVIVDPFNSNNIYSSALGANRAYFNKSLDGGKTFQGNSLGVNTPFAANGDVPFVYYPFIVAQNALNNAPTILYKGGERYIYRSIDNGVTWTHLPAASYYFASGNPAVNLSPSIGSTVIAVAPSDPNVIYVGTSTGRLHVTTDGGINFNRIDLVMPPLPNRFVTDIEVDPRNSSIAYVAYSGFEGNLGNTSSRHVFRTTTRGQTWDDISGTVNTGLPDIPVNCLELNYTRPEIYVGTDIGVFSTRDGGATWDHLAGKGVQGGNLPNTAIFDLKVNYRTNRIYAATFGRGVWELTDNCGLQAMNPSDLPFAAIGVLYTTSFSINGATSPYTFSILSGKLPSGLSFESNTNTIVGVPLESGTFPIKVIASNANGCTSSENYVLRVLSRIIPNPAVLANGVVGNSYNETLTASNGASPYSYTVSAGQLPDGISLSSSGTLMGTFTTAGSFSFTISVTDANGQTGSWDYTLVVTSQACPSITLSPADLTNGIVGIGYNQTITATGGTGPYTINIVAGHLPGGLSLSSSGQITGTPGVTGSFTFTIMALDSTGCAGSQLYSLTINPPNCPSITIAPSALPNGSTGTAYSQTLTATGGVSPYSFSAPFGDLPQGITLSSAGVLSGLPKSGNFSFLIAVIDANGCVSNQIYTLLVDCPSILVNPTTLPNAIAGATYNQTISVTGGISPYTISILEGRLPHGITLSTGELSGVPTELGSFAFTLSIIDSKGCKVIQSYNLIVNCNSVTIAPATLPDTTVGIAYSQSLSVTGGAGSYKFTVLSGVLPTGLTLTTSGTILGTSTRSGNFTFTVAATDTNGCVANQIYTVKNIPIIGLTPSSLPNGQLNSVYSQLVNANGSTSPYSFTVTSGALPAGITLSSTGIISGTPTSAGSFTFELTASDSNGFSGSQSFTLVICGDITISPSSLPNGMVGSAYSQALTINGGTSPFTFSFSSSGGGDFLKRSRKGKDKAKNKQAIEIHPLDGELLPGLTLSATGEISGIPTSEGTYNFTVIVTDANGCSGSQSYTLVISDCATITLSPTSLPNGVAGVFYNESLTANGGNSPYAFNATSGSLPVGLSLSNNGILSGTPSSSGTFAFTVTATSADGCSGNKQYSVTIGDCSTITLSPSSLPSGIIDLSYSQTITATGGAAPYTFTITSGSLPTGLTLTTAGVVSGSPTTEGNFTFTVLATDANSCTGSRSYTIAIHCSTQSFDLPINFFIPTGATSFTVGDFNSDNKLDLVTVSSYLGTVSLFLGDGAGNFGTGTSFTVGTTPQLAVVGDFNGDNKPDLAVTNSGSNNISILLGNGAGSFATATNIAISGAPYQILVGDFNGDSKLDLIAKVRINPSKQAVDILLGDGLGSFSSPIGTTISNSLYQSLAIGDFNGDGKLDLASIFDNTQISIRLGDGLGEFGSTTNFTVGTAPNFIAVADINSDGKLDLAVTNNDSNNVSVLLGTGTGSFGTATNFNVGSAPNSIAIGDYNSDNKLDLAVNNKNESSAQLNESVSLLYGTGTGSFTSTIDFALNIEAQTNLLVNGDFNNDGKLDLAIFEDGYSQVAILLKSCCPLISLSPNSLNDGAIGVSYTGTVSASGGQAPYTFTVTDGNLPAGLSLSQSGTISGLPTEAGYYNFIIAVTDANGCGRSRYYEFSINCPTLDFTPSTLTNGLISTAYSQTISVNGGATPYTFVVAAGVLPNGLTLNSSSGALSGTPTQAGTSTFTITATDANNCTTNKSYTLRICSTTTLSPTTLANGTLNASYSQSISASGDSSPYTFALSTGTLPTGITLATNGTLSGTPTASGTFDFAVIATTSTGCTGSRSYSLTISDCSTITLSPTTLSNGTAGTSYSQTISSSGGATPYSYAVTSGSLPTGITLSTAGALSGTSTVTGTFSFTITATDTNGCTGNRSYSLTINCPTITLSPNTLPNGSLGQSYSQTVSSSSGITPISFAVTTGVLPTGLSLSTSGQITGTPTTAESSTFTITATDANGCTGNKSYSLAINCTTITFSPTSVPNGTIGVAYSQTISASGGNATYTYSITAGDLPNGLTLNSSTGVISGTPTEKTAATNFTVTATGTNGCSDSKVYTITIACPTITLSPTTLSNGQENVAYTSATITASGGFTPYSYTVVSGALPSGMTVSTSGVLSGTPTQSGSFNFTVRATDNKTCTGNQTYILTITCPTITLSPTNGTLPHATAGSTYSQTISASGSNTTFSYAITSGSLPTGITFNTSSGVLSGTATVVGTFNFTVTATGTNSCTGNKAYTLIVDCPTISLSPTTLTNGAISVAYPSQTIAASGGIGSYSYAVTSGALPGGMSLSTAGVLSGTPTASGVFNFTVTATDVNNCTGSQAYTLRICPTITLSPTTLTNRSMGVAFSVTVTASGGASPYSYAKTAGTLPTGVTLSTAGVLSGTATQSGAFNFTVTATDSNGCNGSQAYTLTIDCPTITLSTIVTTATTGTSFTRTITSSGGTSPYSYAKTSGTLPAGVTLSTGGVLSGTPTEAGSFSFTVTATDANGCTGSRSYTLVVSCPTVTLSPTTLPNGTRNASYSQTVTSSGGTASYSYSVTTGNLPQGLTISTGGVISGTPSRTGTENFTITSTDANGCTGSRSYSITIQ